MRRTDFDFKTVAKAALRHAPSILAAWLPDGRREGQEWIARNPKRHDNKPGSFKVSLQTGRWADFATSHKGGDLISLAAYLDGCSQKEAAIKLANALGVAA